MSCMHMLAMNADVLVSMVGPVYLDDFVRVCVLQPRRRALEAVDGITPADPRLGDPMRR